MKLTFVLLMVLFVIVAITVDGQKFTSRRRRSKEIEERINNLDEGTKKRIHAMKASGMPKEAIAEKIAYVAGGKNVAKRIVDALHDEPPKTKGPAPPKKAPVKKQDTKTKKQGKK